MNPVKEPLYHLRGEYTTEQLISMGRKVGKKFGCSNGVILDPFHCRLIKIGGNVTMAPQEHILCHDASTKTFLNYTKIGRVTIGNNVVIGSSSTVNHDVPDGSVVAGSPARVICTLEEYQEKKRNKMVTAPYYGEKYTLCRDVSMDKRLEQNAALEGKIGYID